MSIANRAKGVFLINVILINRCIIESLLSVMLILRKTQQSDELENETSTQNSPYIDIDRYLYRNDCLYQAACKRPRFTGGIFCLMTGCLGHPHRDRALVLATK